MTQTKQEGGAAIDTMNEVNLAKESFGSVALSREEMLGQCVLIDVTGWVQQEMGCAENRYRIEIAVTIRVWRALHAMPETIREFYSVTRRGNDLLWAASAALKRAREQGRSWADFQLALPTSGCHGNDSKWFRAQQHDRVNNYPAVTIGFADE